MLFLSRVRETFCDKEALSRGCGTNVPGVCWNSSQDQGGWSWVGGWEGVEGEMRLERPWEQVMRRLVIYKDQNFTPREMGSH